MLVFLMIGVNMSLYNWPQQEKPREKLMQQGEAALSNAELLAILLGSGSAQKDVITLARDLLNHYHNLHGLFQAKHHSLMQQNGIGMAKYTLIRAVAELNRRYLQEPLAHDSKMTDSKAVKRYLTAELRAHQQEVFACLFLNTKYGLIRFEKMFRGSINNATVHPREVAKRALELNAAALIIAHNHPSGDPQPSEADKNLTSHLVQTLGLIDVHIIDHVIVAGNKTVSFAEQGLL